MLDRLVEGLDPDPGQPAVDQERCVHALSPIASCTACADACPAEAWLLDDDRLALDTAACDGCAVCVPACPEAAITVEPLPASRVRRQGATAFLACDRALAEGPGVLTCLHALGLGDLLQLHHAGVRELVVARVDCAPCPRGRAPRLQGTLTRLRALLEDRGLAPPTVVELAPAAWRARLADPRGRGVGRRGLLTRLTGATAAPPAAAEEIAPGMLLPPATDPTHAPLLPRLPTIDAGRCTGCDACIRLCPHAALTLDRDTPAGLHYRIHPERCTGCGLCADVCTDGAVAVSTDARPRILEIALVEGRCRACGNRHHRPRAQPGADQLCRICRQTHHHRQLFQVLD